MLVIITERIIKNAAAVPITELKNITTSIAFKSTKESPIFMTEHILRYIPAEKSAVLYLKSVTDNIPKAISKMASIKRMPNIKLWKLSGGTSTAEILFAVCVI